MLASSSPMIITTLQALSTLADIGLLIAALFALRQIWIAKEDISIRCMRESITLAIGQVENFRNTILPILNELLALEIQKEFKPKKIPLIDFVAEEINTPALHVHNNNGIKFMNEAGQTLIYDAANMFESLAINFVSKIADEEIAFHPLAKVYCDFVEEHFFFYCSQRKNGQLNPYHNSISLYKIWTTKIKEFNLSYIRENTVRELSALQAGKHESFRPIGVE